MAQPAVCDKVENLFQKWEERLAKINTVDPELIPLHYFFVEDIRSELSVFEKNEIKNLRECPQLDFQKTVNRYDDISFKAKNLSEQLKYKKAHVDNIFYSKAHEYILFQQIDSAHYFLDKALQYNHLHADALLAKAKLLLDEEQFDECISIVHLLYNEADLTREQEMETSDYTLVLYKVLYNTGDSLLNEGRDAEALDIFESLETFCKNIPSAYCNDDYYKAIMLSKSGVYKSFLKIAEVAKQRGNAEIESQFLKYAEEYRETNGLEELPEVDFTQIEISADTVAVNVAEEPMQIVPAPVVSVPQEEPQHPEVQIEEPQQPEIPAENTEKDVQLDCKTIVAQAIDALVAGRRSEAVEKFRAALQIEGCDVISVSEILKLLGE